MARVTDIQVEYHQKRDTLGIGESSPRLSWKVESDTKNWAQKKYELRIVSNGKEIYKGVSESPQSTLVQWPAEPLTSRQHVEVSVRVQGESDSDFSEWSKPVSLETALLQTSDWKAQFIAQSEPKTLRETLFRKAFQVKDSPIVKARLYSTARGVYEVEINGQKVGDHILSPGWTSYTHRIIQQTNDVADLVKSGANAIGIRLADGWFSGWLGMDGGTTNVYGDVNMAIAQLEVTYADGSVDTVATDGSWTWTAGPVLSTSLYNGETYDAREEIPGWSGAGETAGKWSSVKTYPVDVALEPPVGPPIRLTQVLKPVEIFKSVSGKTIVDFGQNFAGYVHINKAKAPKGHQVTIYHAEVMEDGELGRRPLKIAQNTDRYIFKGDDTGESWHPYFTYHGFRYIQVDNWPGELTLDDLEGHVFHTDFEQTGWFESSHKQLNKLHENVCWSMRSNFMSLPTDCPQRDERLGWTGDILLFGPTANYLYSSQGLLLNWLSDLAAEQKDFGVPPLVCPTPLHKWDNYWGNRPIAAWQDAAVMVPWQIYIQTGDLSVLKRQYESMSDWLKQLPRDDDGLFWDPKNRQLGDWLDPAAPPNNPSKSKTDAFMVANAYLIQSTEVVAETASLLGNKADGDKYLKEAKVLRKKFADEYLTPSGRVISHSQTGYAVAVMLRLLDGENGSIWKENSDERMKLAGEQLGKIVEMDGCQIGTGFIGTPIICDALVRTGRADLAYKMLLNDKNPSWLYPITMGATTTWERWDSMLPNGKINPGDMTSFNHYAFGAVADWMHRALGGLSSVSPGWKQVLIKPLLNDKITSASTAHESPFGRISSSWKIDGSNFSLDVTLPANVSGIVELPDGKQHKIGSGTHSFTATL